MRTKYRLGAKGASALERGKWADGAGLWLYKSDKDRGKWVFRFTMFGKRREMGLGAYPGVSLAEARRKADDVREIASGGKDPIKEREKAKSEAMRNLHLLRDIALDAFEARKAQLKDDGRAGRWFSPLELHVLPRLGNIPV